MKSKRFLAALAAMCVLAAPAAFAATAAPQPQQEQTATAASAQQRAAQRRAYKRRAVHRVAYRHHIHLLRRAAKLHLRHRVHRRYAHAARNRSTRALQRSNTRLRLAIRRELRIRRRYGAALRAVPYSTLHAIATCESHNNPRAIGGGGRYRGLFQMTFQIWGAVGGHGDPAAASVREQYYRAALVYRRYGSGQWPVCGR